MLEDGNYIIVLDDFETWSRAGYLFKLTDEQLRRIDDEEARMQDVVSESQTKSWLLGEFANALSSDTGVANG